MPVPCKQNRWCGLPTLLWRGESPWRSQGSIDQNLTEILTKIVHPYKSCRKLFKTLALYRGSVYDMVQTEYLWKHPESFETGCGGTLEKPACAGAEGARPKGRISQAKGQSRHGPVICVCTILWSCLWAAPILFLEEKRHARDPVKDRCDDQHLLI